MMVRDDEPRDVRDVGHHQRADAVRDLANALEVDHPRIRRRSADDHPRLVLLGRLRHIVVVDQLILFAHAVRDDFEIAAAVRQRMSVREVSAVREVHAHDRVAGLEHCEVDRHVGLRAGVRLDVGVFGAEESLRAIDGDVLDDVGGAAAAVVTLARIALGVLVREDRSHRSQHSLRHVVLRGNQLQRVVLPLRFQLDRIRDLAIDFRDQPVEKIVACRGESFLVNGGHRAILPDNSARDVEGARAGDRGRGRDCFRTRRAVRILLLSRQFQHALPAESALRGELSDVRDSVLGLQRLRRTAARRQPRRTDVLSRQSALSFSPCTHRIQSPLSSAPRARLLRDARALSVDVRRHRLRAERRRDLVLRLLQLHRLRRADSARFVRGGAPFMAASRRRLRVDGTRRRAGADLRGRALRERLFSTIFLGPIALIALVYGVIEWCALPARFRAGARQRRAPLRYTLIALLMLFFALGRNNPIVFWLVDQAPRIGRYPEKFVLVLSVALVVLVARYFDKTRYRLVWAIVTLVPLAITAVCALPIDWFAPYDIREDAPLQRVYAKSTIPAGVLSARIEYRKRAAAREPLFGAVTGIRYALLPSPDNMHSLLSRAALELARDRAVEIQRLPPVMADPVALRS